MVGPRPLLWHVMRYYAHFGHTEFVLCLGFGAHHIKDYFLSYRETESNNFMLRNQSGGALRLRHRRLDDPFYVHTGLNSTIGERLRRVRGLLPDDEVFLANYADVLTDLPLDDMVARYHDTGGGGSPLSPSPRIAPFHIVENRIPATCVTAIRPVGDVAMYINGGYFVLRPEVIDRIPPDGDLVGDACAELAKGDGLLAYRYHGFWQSADTVKERNELEAAYQAGTRPWMLWEQCAEEAPLQRLVRGELGADGGELLVPRKVPARPSRSDVVAVHFRCSAATAVSATRVRSWRRSSMAPKPSGPWYPASRASSVTPAPRRSPPPPCRRRRPGPRPRAPSRPPRTPRRRRRRGPSPRDGSRCSGTGSSRRAGRGGHVRDQLALVGLVRAVHHADTQHRDRQVPLAVEETRVGRGGGLGGGVGVDRRVVPARLFERAGERRATARLLQSGGHHVDRVAGVGLQHGDGEVDVTKTLNPAGQVEHHRGPDVFEQRAQGLEIPEVGGVPDHPGRLGTIGGARPGEGVDLRAELRRRAAQVPPKEPRAR